MENNGCIEKKRILILYMPVVHRGYVEFFEKHKREIGKIYLIGKALINKYEEPKEIRAINAFVAKKLVSALGFKSVDIKVLGEKSLKKLRRRKVIMSDDGISRQLAKDYFPYNNVMFCRTFLRWDERRIHKKYPLGYPIAKGRFHQKIMRMLKRHSDKSSDWWRQVAAVVVKDRKIILALMRHNKHMPSEFTPYAIGDMRDFIPAGKLSHISSAIHAEQALVAEAAKEGISLKGSWIYTTTFPCVTCANLIAHTGARRCYFASGHATFDGGKVLESNGVKLFFVK